MRCIWCGKGKGIGYRNGFHYIHTLCVNELLEYADIGKTFFNEFVEKGSISKEFIETKTQNLINFRNEYKKIMETVSNIIKEENNNKKGEKNNIKT